MLRVHRLLRLINILSIDVAFGAVCSAIFFAKLLNVNALPYGLVALGLSVWIIYTIDHLLDAKKASTPAATFRHQFHQRYFKILLRAVIVACLINAVVIIYVREEVFYTGLLTAAGVAIYFIVHKYLRGLKEILIALVYTHGVLLLSITVTSLSVNSWPWVTMIQFLLTALLNLLIFSWFDYANDLKDKNNSISIALGKNKTRWLIIIIFFINGMSMVICNSCFMSATLIIVAMNLVLLLTFIFHNFFEVNDRFRIVGDSVFILPIVYVML